MTPCGHIVVWEQGAEEAGKGSMEIGRVHMKGCRICVSQALKIEDIWKQNDEENILI